MSPQEVEDNIRRCGVEPTAKLIDMIMKIYQAGLAKTDKLPRIGFVCNTDWDVEFYYGQDIRLYPNIEMAEKKLKCAKSCGLTRVLLVEQDRVSEGTDHQR